MTVSIALMAGAAVAVRPAGATAVLLGFVWLTAGYLFLLKKPKLFLLGLLLCRSSLDAAMDAIVLFPGSVWQVNLAGILNALLAAFGIVYLLQRLPSRRKLVLVSGNGAFLVFLAIAGLGVAFSPDHMQSAREWARIFSGFFLYFLVLDVFDSEEGISGLVAAVLVSSVVPIALALWQQTSGTGAITPGLGGTVFANRSFGTFVHPNGLAFYLVIILVLCVAWIPSLRSIRWRGMGGLLTAAAVASLYFTYTRTGWLALVLGMLVLATAYRRKLGAALLVAVLIAYASLPSIAGRFADLTYADLAGAGQSALSSRAQIWRAAIGVFDGSRLWTFGNGLASFPIMISNLLTWYSGPPHNDYLKVLSEVGVWGFGAYLMMWVQPLVMALRGLTGRHPSAKRYASPLAAIVLAMMLVSIGDNLLGYTAVQWYLWALIGAMQKALVFHGAAGKEFVLAEGRARHSRSLSPLETQSVAT